MTESGMPIGRNLEAIRKARGLTLKELDYSSGPRIEKGKDVTVNLISRYMLPHEAFGSQSKVNEQDLKLQIQNQ